MKRFLLICLILLGSINLFAQPAKAGEYLSPLTKEFVKKWPNNRTVNIIFHGHSVPTGYRTRGVVNTFQSYPYLTLKHIKADYPYAVVNVITTSIGGENAEQGAKRFEEDVLCHKPDVIFIDYALNDRSIGLERAKAGWEKMIQAGLKAGVKIVLLTPTPDLTEDIQSEDSPLAKHSEQIRELASKYRVGLVDSYAVFKEFAKTNTLKNYMAQNNHINYWGHVMVADKVYKFIEGED